jgi:hypothetical protein
LSIDHLKEQPLNIKLADWITDQVRIAERILELGPHGASSLLYKTLFGQHHPLAGGCLFFILRLLTCEKALTSLERFSVDSYIADQIKDVAIACLKDPELSDLLKPDIQIVRQYNVHKRLGTLKSDTLKPKL